MKKLRIYIDTSVIGGCFDDEFAQWSNILVNEIKLGKVYAVLSETVAKEIVPALDHIQQKYQEILNYGAEVVNLDEEVLNLFNFYRKKRILPKKFVEDMLHIALAIVRRVDVLVSWNFKHIVHFDKINKFNAANMEMGYPALNIRSPREVI